MTADPMALELKAEAERQGLAVWVLAERSGLAERTVRHALAGGASLVVLRQVGAVLGIEPGWVRRVRT